MMMVYDYERNEKKENFIMKNMLKKIVSIMLVFTIIFSTMQTMTVQAATKAEFSSSNSYCLVKIDQSLINKKGYQYATVQLKTYDLLGWSSGAKVVVTITDTEGNVIWSGVKQATCTLKLGDDHRAYRIYVKPYQEPVKGNIFQQTIINGNNFDNLGRCVTWEISNNKKCTIE